MLTRLVRWQLAIFAVVTVISVTLVSLFYLKVPDALGIGSYQVRRISPLPEGCTRTPT